MNHIKERIGILYKISNDINSKVYIGKTYNTLENRWRLHISDSKKEKRKTRPLYNAMNKYGIEHFKIEELGKYKNGELEKQEILHIEKYDSYYNGYNATMGGDGQLYGDNVDKIFSEEQQKQIIKWFYEYPNISFLSKELNIHYKQLGKILNKYNIKKLKQKPLKIAENSMRIYQIENEEIINVFYSYEEVRCYLINNNLCSKEISTECIRQCINGYRCKTFIGYKWKVIHTKNVFENHIRYEINNSNIFN